MGLYTSYYLYQKYEQREGQDSIPCTPNVYSIDGQGTMEKVIKLDDDPECGYTPEPTEPIYRWYQMPISEGYVCNECPIVPTGDTKFTATYNNSTTYAVECDSTSGITSGETRPQGYQHSAITSVEIGDCVSRIGEFAFDQCYQLTSVRISSGVTHIAYGAFEYTNITNLYIPDSVTSIGDVAGSALEMNGAFGHNSGLTNIEIGTGITSIAEYSFYDTPSLTSVTIHTATPPTTREWAFGHDNVNPNLQIHVPCESVNTYKTAQFWSTYAQYITGIGECPEVGHKLDITYIDNTTYSMDCDSTSAVTSADTTSGSQSKSNIKTVIIGNCVDKIQTKAFDAATSLSSVTLGDSVTEIGSSGFSRCYSLQDINLSGVTKFEQSAFKNCTGLTGSLNLQNAKTFGYFVFSNCSGLTSVDIGSGVTSVYGGAFSISTLTGVTIHATNPPYVNQSSSSTGYQKAFGGSYPIYVPLESVEAYKAARNWITYKNRIQPIGGWGDWSVLKATFSDGTNPYTIECGSVSALTYDTFSSLPSTKMSSLLIGECARSIANGALSRNTYTGLTSVTISSDNFTIGGEAFRDFTSIISLTLTTLTPPTLQNYTDVSYTRAFDGTTFPIYVPAEVVDTYKTANKWTRYADRIQAIP